MKVFKFLVLLSTFILFFGGCDDSEKPFQLTTDYMKQTKWNGTIILKEKGDIVRKGSLSFVFITEREGFYELQWENDEDQSLYHKIIEYSIKGEKMNIKNESRWGAPIDDAEWLIIESSDTHLFLQNWTDGPLAGTEIINLEKNMELN